MRSRRFMAIALVAAVAVVAAVAWWALRDNAGSGAAPTALAGDRGGASAADAARPPPAVKAAASETALAPERVAEPLEVEREAARRIARPLDRKAGRKAIEGDADLDVTTVVAEEEQWICTQIHPKLRIYESQAVAREPDLETLVADQMRRCAEMSEAELRAWTADGRQPSENELRADLAINFEQLRRKWCWGEIVVDTPAELDEPTRVQGLAPGRYVVTLQRGDSPSHPRVFDEKVVELASGTNAVTLSVPVEEESPRVRIAGTVHYSAAWGSHCPSLRFDPVSVAGATEADERNLSELDPDESSPGLYRFAVDGLRPGRYVVTSYKLDWRQSIATGDRGRDDVAIVIPDPAVVRIHLVDDATGRELDEPVIFESAQWDEQARINCVRVVAGEIDLGEPRLAATRIRGVHIVALEGGRQERAHLFDDEFEVVGSTRFRVEPGLNDVTLRVRRATVVAVSVLCTDPSGATMPIETLLKLAPIDDPKQEVRSSMVNSSQWETIFRVAGAGRYRVTVKPIPGYAEVPPTEVTAKQGERVECVIDLVPVR